MPQNLLPSTETALAALGNILNKSQEEVPKISWPTSKIMNNNSKAANLRSSNHHQKMLMAQIARLQTELQIQAVRHQSTIAELRRRLAYISARQTHTPMAVERTLVVRIPLTNNNCNVVNVTVAEQQQQFQESEVNTTAGAAIVARKLGFSVLPDGTGIGGAIVTSIVNESPACKAGLLVLDRICKVDGVDISTNSYTFPQVVELLKGNNTDPQKALLNLEVARFEEPPNMSSSKNIYLDETCYNSSKENNEDSAHFSSSSSSSSSPDDQISPAVCHCQTRIVTKKVASVAVQTLPCLNPWFLADVRTNTKAVRTLRIANSSQEKTNAKQNLSIPPVLPEESFDKKSPQSTSRPLPPLPNFVPPAKMEILVPKMSDFQAKECSDNVQLDGFEEKWPNSPDDSAIHSNQTSTEEPSSSTTLSSQKTWGTTSSSTTISLTTSGDQKSMSSGRSFVSSSAEKKSVDSATSVDQSDKGVNAEASSSSAFIQSPVTMYTNKNHLAHTIRIQQHLFMQAQSSKPQCEAELKDENADHQEDVGNESRLSDAKSAFGEEDFSKRRLSSLSYVSCTSSPIATPNSNRGHRRSVDPASHEDALSWNDGSSGPGCRDLTSSADAGQGYRWVVKVKSDGTRRIVRRPIEDADKSAKDSCTPGEEDAHRRRSHKKHHRHQLDDQKEGKAATRKEKHASKSSSDKRKADPVLAVTTV